MTSRTFKAHNSSGTVAQLELGPLAVRLEQMFRVTLYCARPQYAAFCKEYLARTRWSSKDVEATTKVLLEIRQSQDLDLIAAEAVQGAMGFEVTKEKCTQVWEAITTFFEAANRLGAWVTSREHSSTEPVFFQELSTAQEALRIRSRALERLAVQEPDRRSRLLRTAVRELHRAVELSPWDAHLRNDLGNALTQLAQTVNPKEVDSIYRQAIENYREALRMNSHLWTVYYNMGTVLWKRALRAPQKDLGGLLRSMNEAFTRSHDLNPKDSDTLHNWGTALADISSRVPTTDRIAMLKQAARTLAKAVELDPLDQDAVTNLRMATHLFNSVQRVVRESRRYRKLPILYRRGIWRIAKRGEKPGPTPGSVPQTLKIKSGKVPTLRTAHERLKATMSEPQ